LDPNNGGFPSTLNVDDATFYKNKANGVDFDIAGSSLKQRRSQQRPVAAMHRVSC
jgi:hypothetical protein